MLAAQAVFRCREEAAKLFHVDNPERIVFTHNATHALNLAIKSLLNENGVAVISGMEHNAVTRPLRALKIEKNIRVETAYTPLFEPEMAVHSFEEAVDGRVSCVICTHVSNVFGYILPIERIDEICSKYSVPFVIDASQSAGCLDIDVALFKSRVFVCMPGHKGLYGPQGTGILICPPDARIRTLMEGGTGSNSALSDMPDFLPDRLESGTHNTPGIAGLYEGLRYINQKGVSQIFSHNIELIEFAQEALAGLRRVRTYSSEHLFSQAGVLSFNIEGMDCEDVAGILADKGIAVRAGLHCAPAAHKTAGTFPEGTVRVSVSSFNSRRDIQGLVNVVKSISKLRTDQ
jgi:cysteine desulfurase family protein